ncbi:hypothetical protein ACWOBE_01460 [Hutsoniella sourekii]
MARKNNKRNKLKAKQEDLVAVDIYYLPRAQAEMYRVLREAVASEVGDWLQKRSSRVERLADEEFGEALVAYDNQDQELYRYYLNPSNISQAQKARDKEALDVYLEHKFE